MKIGKILVVGLIGLLLVVGLVLSSCEKCGGCYYKPIGPDYSWCNYETTCAVGIAFNSGASYQADCNCK